MSGRVGRGEDEREVWEGGGLERQTVNSRWWLEGWLEGRTVSGGRIWEGMNERMGKRKKGWEGRDERWVTKERVGRWKGG